MLTAFDVGFGILVLISAILATARGLTREVLSLVTWAGSAAIAWFMYEHHQEIAQGFIKDPTVAAIATVVVSFIVSLIILHLITMRIADFVVDSRIGPVDRALGFLFGVLRGVLIAIVVVIFGRWLVPGALPDWAAQSKSFPVLNNMGDSLIAALPPNLEQQVTAVLQHHGGQQAPDTTQGEPQDENDNGPLDTAPGNGNSTAPAGGLTTGGTTTAAPATQSP